jgi:Flp pilus assembly protein TadD
LEYHHPAFAGEDMRASIFVVASALLATACSGPWRERGAEELGINREVYQSIRTMLNGGRVIEAKTALNQMPVTLRATPAWEYLMGRACLVEGNVDEAVARLERARDWSHSSPVVVNDLSVALVRAGRPDEAVVMMEKLSGDNPDDKDVRLNLAVARLGAGRTVEAQEALTVLSRDHPGWFEAHYNLGLAALTNHDYQIAVVEFREADKIRMGDKGVLLGMAMSCALASDKACAETASREVLARFPQDLGAILNWGAYLEEQGDLAGARDQYLKATRLGPGCANCWYNLGRLSERMGDPVTAIDAYRKHLSAAPKGMPVQAVELRLKALTEPPPLPPPEPPVR